MSVVINDIVRFLDSFQPASVDRLRSSFPAAKAIFNSEGYALGAGDELLPAGFEASRLMLKSVEEVAWGAVTQARSRLTLARRLEFVSQLLSLASFGVLLKLILGGTNLGEARAPLVIAAVGVVANATPLGVSFLRGDPIGGTGALQQHYAQLRDAVWAARTLLIELDQHSPADETVASLVAQANELARRTFQTLTDLGYAAPLPAKVG
jgi:hypothetical protein